MDEQIITQDRRDDFVSVQRAIHDLLEETPKVRVIDSCRAGYLFEAKGKAQTAVYWSFQTLAIVPDPYKAWYRLQQSRQKSPDLDFDHDAVDKSHLDGCPNPRSNSRRAYSV